MSSRNNAGRTKNKSLLIILPIMLLAGVILLALSWKAIAVYFFYDDFYAFETWLREVESRADSQPAPVSVKPLRQPIFEKKDRSYRTTLAMNNPESPRAKFEIHARKGDKIDVGIAHIADSGTAIAWDYVIKVYEAKNGKRKKVIDVSRNFKMQSWELFQIAATTEDENNGVMEIEYEIKPRGIKGHIASIISKIKGAPPYYKDFAFMVPTVLHRKEPDELNVIIVSLDTLRPDHLGCFGYPRPTSPNIDSFAGNGILFTQAISASPWTTPAHFSLLTGLYPSSLMEYRKNNPYKYNYYADSTVAEILRNNGYYTVAFCGGMNLASNRGFGLGFDQYLEFPWKYRNTTQRIFDNSIDWLDSNSDRKFFMFVHTYECHDPYENTYFFKKEKPTALIDRRRALYDGDIRHADSYFGKLVKELDSLGLLSKTIIAVVSDHGDEFYDHYTEDDRVPRPRGRSARWANKIDHGHSVYDEIVRILMIFHIPGLSAKGSVFNNQARLIDVAPTILDYLGIRPDEPMQGVSLLPLMREGERAQDPPAISEFSLHGPERKSVRMNGYKYIYVPDPEGKRTGVTYKDIPQYALFDLKSDPKERENIYEQNKELAAKYQEILDKTLEESLAIKNGLRERNKHREENVNELSKDVAEDLKALGYLQ